MDPFAGSGTTALATLQTSRQSISIEERQEAIEKYIGPRVAGVGAETS
ncbi:DNA methyltransferase [Arthrobacter alpinus]|nr:DNA methyltransferase [Arthrobacter alpinus]